MLLAGIGCSFAFEHEGLTYRVVDNDAKTVKVSYQGSTPDTNPYTQSSIEIPSIVPFNGSDYTVVEIGESAFKYASLSTITIAPTVKTIGDYAFQNCKNLTIIDVSTVEFFGINIFSNCSNLASVELPKTLQSIPNGMFSTCLSLTSFTFPENITSIGNNAFKGTGLTSVTIPCRDIGAHAFGTCRQLTNVTLLGDGYMMSSNVFGGSDKINTIVCLGRFSGSVDLGFSDDVKENATVYAPKSQMRNWSSFLNVNEVTISNVGKHVIDVYPYDHNGRVFVNGESIDCLYGKTLLAEPGSNVEIEFVYNGSSDYYEIETFTLNGNDMTSSVVDNKYTITNVSGNQNIQTTWKIGATYNLSTSLNSEGGNIFVNGNQVWNDTKKYPANKDITLLIQPNTGYGISSFNINYEDKKGDLKDNGDGTYSYTFTLTRDMNINLYFDKKWNLTTTFNAGGTVTIGGESVTSGTTKEIIGAMKEVVVTSNTGYEIASVLHNGSEQLNKSNYIYWSFWPTSDQGDNQTLAVTFTISKYKLIYMVDDAEYKSYEVEYGAAITPESDPVKDGYTFSGWSDIPKTMPAHDVIVTGSFIVNKYNLIYMVDGEVYKSYEVEYGATITPEPDPIKEGYTFSGWSWIPSRMPAEDVTITGTFTKNEYNINGTIYQVDGDEATLSDGKNSEGDVVIPITIEIEGTTYKVTSIANNAFSGNTSVTSIIIPEGIVKIGDNAFNGCSILLFISIGKDITEIGEKAFANIGPSTNASRRAEGEGLIVECYAESVPTAADDAFEGTPINSATLLVNDNFVSAYKATMPWSKFGTIMGFNEAAGIKAIWANEDGNAQIFSLDGKTLNEPQKGVNIVRMSNGQVRKVVVK